MSSFFDKQIQNPKLRELAEWLLALLIAVVIFFILRQFLFRTVRIMGISMEPAFYHGERLIVSKVPYWLAAPDYGDVIAFPYKEDPSQKYIKRIIGLSGDEIDFADNQFTVNSVPIEGDPINAFGNVIFPLIVPEGTFFVLGDNRNASKDSRYQEVGCVPQKDIVGKAVLRFWPPGRVGVGNW